MIGPTVKIKGEIHSEENLLIEGKVQGTITAKSHEVTVGKSGAVKANIVAKIVRIEGAVQGDIQGGEKVIIAASGNVKGNIVTPRMSLEDGAKFKGSIDMDPGEQVTSDLPLTSAPAPKSNASPGAPQAKPAIKSGVSP